MALWRGFALAQFLGSAMSFFSHDVWMGAGESILQPCWWRRASCDSKAELHPKYETYTHQRSVHRRSLERSSRMYKSEKDQARSIPARAVITWNAAHCWVSWVQTSLDGEISTFPWRPGRLTLTARRKNKFTEKKFISQRALGLEYPSQAGYRQVPKLGYIYHEGEMRMTKNS